MHILLIHQAFVALSEPGGTRHHELARALVQKGHTMTVIASPVSYLTGQAIGNNTRGKKPEILEPGITLIRVYTYPALHKSFFHRVISFFSFMFSSFFAAMKVKNVDLVWGTSPPIFQGFTAWLTARLKRAAFVFEIRDLWPAFAVAAGVLQNRILIRFSLWLERFLYSRADTLIVNSPGFIDHVRKKGAKHIVLIPNGADAEMFRSKNPAIAFKWAENLRGKFICLYAGAHGLSNDLGTIVEAAQILKTDPSVAFVLVGDGKEKQVLQEHVASLNLANIHFLPPVPKEDMIRVLSGANACMAILKPLELYKTTYPNKVFDYMAAGKPVILAIDGVIREVVEDANAGIFVQPGIPQALVKGILYLKSHPDEARQMGKNGRDYVIHNFDRAKISMELEIALVQTLIDIQTKHRRVDGSTSNRHNSL
jgi:glycosyltransferase involved in cell wall biosynthesis